MDQVNGPVDSYLRGDNLIHDDEGILSLRLGSRTLNPDANGGNTGAPVPMLSSSSSVHSLFTTVLNGERCRFAGVDDGVFKNFVQIASNFPGTGDISFGSYQGLVFMARGSQKFKHDGTITRNWGIARPTAAPNVSAVPSDEATFSNFDDGENPPWEASEGTVESGVGKDDATTGARLLTPDVNGKVTITKTWGGAQNFNQYDGGDTGQDEDLIEFDVWLQSPDNLEAFTLGIDVSGDGDQKQFEEDYYFHEFLLDDNVDMTLDKSDVLSDQYEVEGYARRQLEDEFEEGHGKRFPKGARFRRDTPDEESNSGWAHFSVPRGSFTREGSTPGRNWSTVRAVQFTIKVKAGEGITIGYTKLDNLKITGGRRHPFTGRFTAKYIFTRNWGSYIEKSGPSEISDEIELKANALNVTIPASASAAADGQVNEPGGEIWVYVAGGSLGAFFRGATKVKGSNNAITVRVEMSERDMIVLNERLESDTEVPPNDIIAILPPHHGRTIVVTRDTIYPSRIFNPGSFGALQTLKLGDPTEEIQWAIKGNQGVQIGTNKDIYLLGGDGSENQDGTINFRLDEYDVQPPAVSGAVCQDGPLTAYIASDGPRFFAASQVQDIRENLDLLYQGYTRYGVSAPNLGSDPGRFRMGLFAGRLYQLTPEGLSGPASGVIHVFVMRRKQWYRFTYARSFQSLYREPDGKLLAGDSSGMVWQLETGDIDRQNDAASNEIPVQWWTKADDNGDPLQFKSMMDFRLELESGGNTDAQIGLYLDNSTSAFLTLLSNFNALPGAFPEMYPMGPAARWRRLQLRISGTFRAFKLRSIGIPYRNSPMPRLYWESDILDLGEEVVWVRKIRYRMLMRGPCTVKLIVDGYERSSNIVTLPAIQQAPSAFSATQSPQIVEDDISLGRGIHGKVFQVRISTQNNDSQFEVYKIKLLRRVSGNVTEMKWVPVPPQTERIEK